MADQVPFINRETELGQIEVLVGEWGTRRVLFIYGQGGIGKTRLLQEVRKRYADRKAVSRLHVLDIIDFDDRTFHIPQNVGRSIAMALGEEAFEPYMRGLLDWRKMETANVSPEGLAEKREQINQILIDNFNRVSSTRRIVLLLDTTDALEKMDVWNYISDLALHIKNALLLVAGRNADVLWEKLKSEIGEDAQLIELPPLEPEASERYLQQKQKLRHVTLAPEIAQKLLLLARGRPILIDLAVEWMAREIPLDWLVEEDIAQLEKLSDEEMKERQKAFEYQLVHHIANIRTQMDRLILALSRIYPLDREMIVELLGLSEEESEELLEEARTFTYVFIKPLPDGRITLHDEMRRMVNEHIWPEIDPQGERQRRDSTRAIAYLEHKLKTLREQIAQLGKVEKATYEERDAKELEAFLEREALERELWGLEEQRLRHTLPVNLTEGIEVFAKMFDEATQVYRFSFRQTLISEVQQYWDQLSPDQRYIVDIRRAKHMLDCGEYQAGKELLLEMLNYPGLQPSQKVDMYIQLGNLEIRLGDFGAGREYFEEAVRLSQEHNLEDWLTRALNALGWGHRLVGHFELAVRHYEEALELSIRLKDRRREAWILNNMAFALAHLGQLGAALNLCDQALALWREVKFDRGLGAVHEVYGEIYVLFERLDKALSHYRAALDIFEPSDDREWLSRVYAGCGLAYRLSGDLDSAEAILNKALDIGLEKDKALILHRLAHIYQERGQIDKAEQYFVQSHDLCDTTLEADLKLNNLSDLAGIALLKGQYDRIEEFAVSFEEYKRRWPDVNFPRAVGTLLKNLGDLALYATPDNMEPAWGYYKEAFPLLAKHGNLRPYSVQAQLGHLNSLLVAPQVPEQTVRELGTRFRELWRQKGLDSEHPDALRFFLRWKEGEYLWLTNGWPHHR